LYCQVHSDLIDDAPSSSAKAFGSVLVPCQNIA
jgi:hypothetical protein